MEEEIKVINKIVVVDEYVICVLLGGVDFIVVVIFVYKVIGDRFYCIFVDNGLLRLDNKFVFLVVLYIFSMFFF